MVGTVFNIQRFCVNDGPGIRTAVFFKGCPLNCLWCHNPESKIATPQIMYDANKCISCGRCVNVCSNHCILNGTHIYLRENCTACGKCIDACLSSAFDKAGYEIESADVLKEILRDRAFYKNSGGGITLSGGEPMAQPKFALEILKMAKENSLHTCMETCGHASAENFTAVAPYVDIFLFDWKITNCNKHKKYTGVPNTLILSNLKLLDSIGAKIILRCPIIPTVNDNSEHFKGIADIANSLKNILQIEIEPYHPLGKTKSEKLGQNYAFSDIEIVNNETAAKWIAEIGSYTSIPVKKA